MLDHPPAPRRAALGALAALVAIAAGGCSATGDPTPGESGPPSGSAAAPAASSGVSIAPSEAAPRTIPASAFFEMPANMRRSDRTPAEGSEAVPELCDGELDAGTGAVASAAMRTVYKQPQDPAESVPHGVLFQTIRSYGGDSAAAFMDRLEDRLADCRSYRDGESTVKVKTAPLRGDADEALTIDLIRPQTDLPGNPVGGEQTNRIVVMRFDAVVTVLYDGEYERSSSVPAIVDTFVSETTQAIRSWRG
jgi:hypothetical protein